MHGVRLACWLIGLPCASNLCHVETSGDGELQDGRAAAAALQPECLAAGDRCSMLLNDGVRTVNCSDDGGSHRRVSGVTTLSGQR